MTPDPLPQHLSEVCEAPPEVPTDVTVLLPAYNEAENLRDLLPRVAAILDALPGDNRILVVDDGSRDGTARVAEELALPVPQRVLRLRMNSGKSAALQAGFRTLRSSWVVLMDADGQDVPEEIPRMLEHARAERLALVTGARGRRQDRRVKRWTSKIYNRVTASMTGIEGSDFNSGLKLIRGDAAESLTLYGELHRYIPVLAHWNGFGTGELVVDHRDRLHGRSKFGRARFWRGALDLVTVKFLTRYTSRPFHLFGGFAALCLFAGLALLLWMLAVKVGGQPVGTRPALQAGALLTILGVQLGSFGLVAELVVHLRGGQDVARLVESDLVHPARQAAQAPTTIAAQPVISEPPTLPPGEPAR